MYMCLLHTGRPSFKAIFSEMAPVFHQFSVWTIRKCSVGKDLVMLWCILASCTEWEVQLSDRPWGYWYKWLHSTTGVFQLFFNHVFFEYAFKNASLTVSKHSQMEKKCFRKYIAYIYMWIYIYKLINNCHFQMFWRKKIIFSCGERERARKNYTHMQVYEHSQVHSDFLSQATNEAAWGFPNSVRCPLHCTASRTHLYKLLSHSHPQSACIKI